MKQLLCFTAFLAIAAARPELYKETEDFQYARSSSDEGTKSGYYGAKRGNMGGNYEKAHNMDHLAQNQMSGLVRQVDGEVGGSAKLRAGHVFADASSSGIYGSGHYDTSNLHGRNFQEGVREGSFADSHSALASHNSGYVAGQAAQYTSDYNRLAAAANSRYTGYQGTKSAQALHSANHQSTGQVAGEYGSESGYSAGHESQYQYNGAHNSHYAVVPTNRLISTMPARVVVRPGGTVAVPVGVQNYDASHSASSMDHNTINTDAEVLTVPDYVVYKPSTGSKYYESSSSYKKHWENHDTKAEVIPLAIPTANPFPVNSELYDDNRALHTSSHNAMNSNAYSGYNANVNSASSHSKYGAAHDAQFTSGLNSNTHGAYVGGVSNGLESTIPATKSHSSSYSYHKSWERQGDPYVITPVGGVDTAASQRLTAASANQGYSSSHQYGTKSSAQRSYQANGIDCDCDENGQIRVPRSVDHKHYANQQSQDFGQQTQNEWDDLTQQTVTGWNHQRPNSEKLVNFGQQTQQKQTGTLTQQTHTGSGREGNRWSENLEEFGRQNQREWSDLAQQTQTAFDRQRERTTAGWESQRNKGSDKLEDFGQQNQKEWRDLSQQTQSAFDRQRERTSAGWDRQRNRGSERLQEFGQQNQKEWSDLSQQTQTAYDRQRERTAAGWEHQRNRGSDKLVEFGQQNQKEWRDLSQQTQSAFDRQRARTSAGWENQRNKASENLEDFGQETQREWGDLTQQAQTGWNHQHDRAPAAWDHQRNRASNKLRDFGQERLHQSDDLTQQTQTDFGQQKQVPWNMKDTDTPFTNPKQNQDIVQKPQTPWHWHYEDIDKEVRPTKDTDIEHEQHNKNITSDYQQIQTQIYFGQQAQVPWNIKETDNPFKNPKQNQDIVQKPQIPWDWHLENIEKEVRKTPDTDIVHEHHNKNITYDDQQIQTQTDLGQQTQVPWNMKETDTPFKNTKQNQDIVQKPQIPWDWHFENIEKEVRTTQDTDIAHEHHNKNITSVDQQIQTQTDFGQQAQVPWNMKETDNPFKNPKQNQDIVQKPRIPWDWHYENIEKEVRPTNNTDIDHNKDSTFDDQQIQTHTDFGHNFDIKNNDSRDNLKNEQSENDGVHNQHLDQHNNNWQKFNDDDIQQQTHQTSEGFFHYSNINKDVSSDKKVERQNEYHTDDDTQQIVKNPFSGIYIRPNPLTPIQETQRSNNETYRNNETQQAWQTNGNSGWHTWLEQNTSGRSNGSTQRPQQRSSLQSVWDKINKFDQTSKTNIHDNRKENSAFSWQGQTTAQTTYGSSVGNGYRSEDSSTFQHNFNNTNQNATNGYNHWIPMIGDPGIINSAPHNNNNNNTLKPKQNHHNDNIRPVDHKDVGRGDIGSESSSKTTTTEKSFISGYSQGFPIFTADKREKTPEEIEALSLTISADRANKSKVFNGSQTQYSEDRLKVLSLEQQKWLDGKQHHDSRYIFTSNKTVISATEGKNDETLDMGEQWTDEEQRAEPQSGRDFFSNQYEQGKVESDSQQIGSNLYANKPIMQWFNKPAFNSENQLFTNKPQSNVETDHNLQQQIEGKGIFDQQSQSVWREDFQNGQENKHFEHKTQAAWEQNLADFEQQEQPVWKPEDLQQEDTQQLENLARSNIDQYQTQNFYNQQYFNTQVNIKNKSEELKAPPEQPPQMETSKIVPDSQSSMPHVQLILEPLETTEKPGFWKSVGQKFTNAKDKVAMWFKQTQLF